MTSLPPWTTEFPMAMNSAVPLILMFSFDIFVDGSAVTSAKKDMNVQSAQYIL